MYYTYRGVLCTQTINYEDRPFPNKHKAHIWDIKERLMILNKHNTRVMAAGPVQA